jgi:hypothetical protein
MPARCSECEHVNRGAGVDVHLRRHRPHSSAPLWLSISGWRKLVLR